jgi:hypothetical protein
VIILDSTFTLEAEQELLLFCARTSMDDETERKIKYLVRSDLNWDYLLEIASKHGLKPLLYWQLHIICPDEIPSEFMHNLKEFLKTNATKNLFFMKELIAIIKTLNDHHIESVPYKGPILAQQVYGNLTMREFGDLDIYVKKEDVPKIKDILISKGYKPQFNLNSSQEQNYLNSQRELKFIHEIKGISLELHWKFSGVFLNLPSNAEMIFLNKLNTLNIGGIQIPEITPENLVLILSIHNASHQWSRLSWLVDIATLINNQKIDWSKIIKLSQQLSIQKILFINLYLCQSLLDLEMDVDIKKYLQDNSVIKTSNIFAKEIFLDEKENSLIKNLEMSIIMRENKIDAIKDGLSGIFHPSFYELTRLDLSPSLYFLYYIYRPFNLLKRHKLK